MTGSLCFPLEGPRLEIFSPPIISMWAYAHESSRAKSWMRRSVEDWAEFLFPLPSACSRSSFLSEPQEEALQCCLAPSHNPVAKVWQKAIEKKRKLILLIILAAIPFSNLIPEITTKLMLSTD